MNYPKWIYHKTEAPKIVNSEAEHEQAGKGWEETPAAFDQRSDEKAEKSTDDQAQTSKALAEADFSEMNKSQIIEFILSKDESRDEKSLKKMTKDDLIALVGQL